MKSKILFSALILFALMLTHGYEYDLYFSDIDAQTFIYGHSKEYKLNVIRNDGNFRSSPRL
jgi:hypothetical protein